MELKIQTIEYTPGAFLEYVVQDPVVVYCGITDIRQLPEEASTTNAASEILQALAKAIGRPADALTFFELMTRTSWILRTGEYDFQSVAPSYSWKDAGVLFKRTTAPKAILQAFRHRIGGDAARRYEPKSEEVADASIIEA